MSQENISYRKHHRRDARQGRPDPAQSPAGAQRAQPRADARTDGGARRVRGRRQDRLHGDHRSDKAFAAGADIKEMADKTFTDVYLGDFAADVGSRRDGAQAGDRRGRRLRARRRLRAGHAVRSHHRRRQREIRPAGDQARHHSGHRRHAAPHPRGRQGQGDGHDPHRPHDGRRGSRALRASSPAWCRWRTCSTRR